MQNELDTITAIATPNGNGAIAIIRLSGGRSFDIINKIFVSSSPVDFDNNSKIIKYGIINDKDEILDEVLVSFFKKPYSYTGENSVEINCHGSLYIQKRVVELLVEIGARLAKPGEFTERAFLNGKLDLSQAEAVADVIASNNRIAHKVAINQMRGGFSVLLKELRDKLIHFTALLELELDFADEDVEFANREQVFELLEQISTEIEKLLNSFKFGNVIKNGIPVAIIGKPNVGKSTLLNTILNEEKAIVSKIPGTTRDAIEDVFSINGILFRFIDTAGLRESDDIIENMGIEKTYKKIEQASIILYLVDINDTTSEEIINNINDFRQHIENQDKKFVILLNKIDLLSEMPHHFKELKDFETLFISAKKNENIDLLKEILIKSVNINELNSDIILTNTRHYEALLNSHKALESIKKSFQNNIPTDLITIDIKSVLYDIGSITGEISSNDILSAIFSKFCIGK